MSLIYAYSNKGLTEDITIQDSAGATVTPGASDKVRVIIGRDGETAKLTVTSDAPTDNGSSITKGAVNRLRLDASDLSFTPGIYTMTVDLYDHLDATEWKCVSRQVFCLEGSVASHIVDVSEILFELGLSATVTEEQRGMALGAIVGAEASVRRFLGYDPLLASRVEYHPSQPFQAQISRGIWEVMEQRAVMRQVSEAATNELQLQHLPVRGTPLVVVRVDYDGRSESRAGSFPTESEKVIGQDFWPNYDCVDASGVKVCRDGVLRTIGLWPTTAGTVKITYTAGYTPDELRGSDPIVNGAPIWEATKEEAVRRARRIAAQKYGRVGLPAGVFTSENLGSYSYTMDSATVARLFGGDLLPESKERLSSFVNYGWHLGS